MTIKATIVADSIYEGKRLTTFELELPRWIWSEMLTHRLFSRNAASSRAIPVKTTARQIKDNPEFPIVWGKKKSGMQSEGELSTWKMYLASNVWKYTAKLAATSSIILDKLGLHKQWANRVAEYAQSYKVVVTATDFDNFFHLRRHKDAQPEIKALADEMYEALKTNQPNSLRKGEWHLPYITSKIEDGFIQYFSEGIPVSLEDAQKISVSACAQVSYRKLDTSLEKAKKIFDMLIKAEVIHASPFEHVATPIIAVNDWQDGVTHMDKQGNFWSGNFKGWVQYRHLLANNTCINYKG